MKTKESFTFWRAEAGKEEEEERKETGNKTGDDR